MMINCHHTGICNNPENDTGLLMVKDLGMDNEKEVRVGTWHRIFKLLRPETDIEVGVERTRLIGFIYLILLFSVSMFQVSFLFINFIKLSPNLHH